MPLYDCMLLVKPNVNKSMVMDLIGRIGKRVYQRNGVVTDLKSFGNLQLAYGIRKLDGKHFQGQLMQISLMVPPTFHKELQYLNKEDRLLRWLVVKHRKDAVYGMDVLNDGEDSGHFTWSNVDKDEDEDDDMDKDDDDEEEDHEQV